MGRETWDVRCVMNSAMGLLQSRLTVHSRELEGVAGPDEAADHVRWVKSATVSLN